MDEPTPSTEPRGMEFLELLENKHNQVLTELDALNARIEKVLSMYTNRGTDGGEQVGSSRKAA